MAKIKAIQGYCQPRLQQIGRFAHVARISPLNETIDCGS